MPNDTSKPSLPVLGRLSQFDLFPPRPVVPPNDATVYVPPGPWLPALVSTLPLDWEPDSEPPETFAQPGNTSPGDPCEPVPATPTSSRPGRIRLLPLFTNVPYAWEEAVCEPIADEEERCCRPPAPAKRR